MIRARQISFLSAFFAAGVLLLSGCATTGLPRIRHEVFQNLSTAPSVYVVSPQLDAVAGFAYNSREFLTPLVKEAHQKMMEEFIGELEKKGYRASGHLMDFDELPKDAQEERLRNVISECYGEFYRMGGALLRNLKDEKEKPLDYQLGRRALELAGMLDPKPDWLFFSHSDSYLIGIVPTSEKVTLGVLMGIGISPPGYDFIAHQAGIVNAATGELLWFNSSFDMAHSLLFSSSRRATVQRFMKELPSPGGTEAGSRKGDSP